MRYTEGPAQTCTSGVALSAFLNYLAAVVVTVPQCVQFCMSSDASPAYRFRAEKENLAGAVMPFE